MHRREFVLSATGILGATTVGSIAYTNATVTRGVSSSIAADKDAIIDLDAGAVSAVTENSDGELNIDTSTSNSSGLNGNATFTYGKSGSPTTDFAFSVTNNDGSDHDLTVGLLNMSLPGNSSFEVTFYDDTGTEVGVATPSTDFSYTGWASTETLYALIDIDTTDATDTDDFSGDIQFSAGPDTS